ncbi:MAG: glycosyltransferase, partial [Thermoguttaceae bacterium]|nr:glycosyltransferase [Thermoguttaceae bacterium]
MERSLSALLPVRNIEATLATTVWEWLETLAELAREVELVVVDDCSCDATIEVADDLVGRYPQLRVIRHPTPLGRVAALQTAYRQSSKSVVFFADEHCDLSIGELRRLWLPLDRYEVVLGRPIGSPPHWDRWGDAWRAGYQMGYRRVLEPFLDAMGDQRTLLDELIRHGVRWLDVEVPSRRPAVAPRRIASMARRLYS